jgi:hypothetical protein
LSPLNRLAINGRYAHRFAMGNPNNQVTLSSEQVDELNRKLSNLRHDINNHLSLIVAAIELIRHKPELRERMTATLIEQPPKIMNDLGKFSSEFERVFGTPRD